MTNLAILKDVIPTQQEGPLLSFDRHSYRRFSFRLARETPYYFDTEQTPPPWNKRRYWQQKWFEAHSEREVQYWRAVFDSQLATTVHKETQAIQRVPCPPDAEEYAIYPSKNWILVSIEFSRLVIPPGSLPFPDWWQAMSNWERKRNKTWEVCALEDCKNFFVYPLKPRKVNNV